MASLLTMVRQLVTSVAGSGLGALTLGAAATGFRDFAGAGAVSGKTYSYAILEGVNFEAGRGRYLGATFARDVVTMSSTGPGNKQVFTASALLICTPLPEDLTELEVFNLGNSGTATQTFDVSAYKIQKLTVTGAHTWAFSNWPAAYGELEVLAVNAGAFALTLPTVNWVKGDGTVTTSFAALGIALQASGVNTFIFWTYDGGTTIYGKAA